MVPPTVPGRVIVLKSLYKLLLAEIDQKNWQYLRSLCQDVEVGDVKNGTVKEKWFENFNQCLLITVTFHSLKSPNAAWLRKGLEELTAGYVNTSLGKGVKAGLWDCICTDFNMLWSKVKPEKKPHSKQHNGSNLIANDLPQAS
jgi:hypothetical protein